MKNNLTGIALLAGILIFLNLLSHEFFFRWDVTQDKQYTLSPATKNILKELDQPVMVKAYFTGDLPAQYQKPQEDFRDLLYEYASRSGAMVDYEFINPGDSEEGEQEALQNGISPLLINVREKDQSVQKKAFMGAVIESGSLKDVIPFVQPEGPMEYQLTTSIKKVSRADKPSVALIQGHGEPGMQAIQQAVQTLNILYNVEPVDLNSVTTIDPRFKTAIMLKPADTIPVAHLQALEAYMQGGGNLFLATDRVDGNFQTVQGSAFSVGLEGWLRSRGVEIQPQFIVDASSGSISVQQQQGFFRFNTAVEFPYFPLVKRFGEHPVTKGLEQVVFQFVSPLNFIGDSSTSFTPLVRTSNKSGIQQPPIYFDIEKRWSNSDFPMQALTIGGLVEYANGSSMIVFSDGDFTMGPQSRGQNPDNISLMVNAIDFLSDDTGLIELRTKGVTTRPIDEMEEAEMTTIKWASFLLPIILIVLYGIFRFQRNRNRRLRRMAADYS